MGKKVWRPIWFRSTRFCYYRKHSNSDNKICLLTSSCFQQHFHDKFYVLKYNTDLSKLEWTLLLFTFNYICGLKNKLKLFSILVAEYAKSYLLGLISNFSQYYFKTDPIYILFLSSHVFTALEFDSNHFGVLLWKIVKPRDHNEIKPSIGKRFW